MCLHTDPRSKVMLEASSFFITLKNEPRDSVTRVNSVCVKMKMVFACFIPLSPRQTNNDSWLLSTFIHLSTVGFVSMKEANISPSIMMTIRESPREQSKCFKFRMNTLTLSVTKFLDSFKKWESGRTLQILENFCTFRQNSFSKFVVFAENKNWPTNGFWGIESCEHFCDTVARMLVCKNKPNHFLIFLPLKRINLAQLVTTFVGKILPDSWEDSLWLCVYVCICANTNMKSHAGQHAWERIRIFRVIVQENAKCQRIVENCNLFVDCDNNQWISTTASTTKQTAKIIKKRGKHKHNLSSTKRISERKTEN